ncbi:ABC transporter permease [Asanoa sp. NPDC049573]|uniref:ABC transporter permease n=1 Tax=Asanoa sp. NPDC049573 TaxID=3155396 RepID=UPI00342E00A0
MTWLTWRQFRAQSSAVVGVVAVLVVAFAVTGPQLAHLFDASGLPSCVSGADCQSALTHFAAAVNASKVYPLLYVAGLAALYGMPAVLGIFWGAPLIARELETGTVRLAWSQSVSRVRWAATKVGLIALAAGAAAALLSLAVTWWAGPIDRAAALAGQGQGLGFPHRFMPLVFGARDVVPIGHAVFAFALGVTVGLVVRRTLPAMALTLAAVAAMQVVVPTTVRAHYATPAETSMALTLAPETPHSIFITDDTLEVSMPVTLPGDWITSIRAVDAAGQPFTGPAPQICISPTSSMADCDAAVNALHLRQLVSYQPADRYWTFQWYETAIYFVLALALAAFSVARVRRIRLS